MWHFLFIRSSISVKVRYGPDRWWENFPCFVSNQLSSHLSLWFSDLVPYLNSYSDLKRTFTYASARGGGGGLMTCKVELALQRSVVSFQWECGLYLSQFRIHMEGACWIDDDELVFKNGTHSTSRSNTRTVRPKFYEGGTGCEFKNAITFHNLLQELVVALTCTWLPFSFPCW